METFGEEMNNKKYHATERELEEKKQRLKETLEKLLREV